MAIQIPSVGTGFPADQTGDSPWLATKKIAENFSNTTHAASRLVGTNTGNVPLSEDTFKAANDRVSAVINDTSYDCNNMPTGTRALVIGSSANTPPSIAGNSYWLIDHIRANTADQRSLQIAYGYTVNAMMIRGLFGTTWRNWTKVYTDNNTTVDGNGLLKPSSPVLRVFNDRIEGNDDGDTMGAMYTKNGVGDYTISGTTGLRTDGWHIVTPNDMNGNPHVAVTLDDTDGVITLRSYVRIFDMTTFKFVPDLEQPLDIPEGRWIDLRFNDLPAEPMPPEV